jgi:hypothetical protein
MGRSVQLKIRMGANGSAELLEVLDRLRIRIASTFMCRKQQTASRQWGPTQRTKSPHLSQPSVTAFLQLISCGMCYLRESWAFVWLLRSSTGHYTLALLYFNPGQHCSNLDGIAIHCRTPTHASQSIVSEYCNLFAIAGLSEFCACTHLYMEATPGRPVVIERPWHKVRCKSCWHCVRAPVQSLRGTSVLFSDTFKACFDELNLLPHLELGNWNGSSTSNKTSAPSTSSSWPLCAGEQR